MNRLLLWLCVALWLGVFIWAGTVCYLSSLSGPQIEQMLAFPVWDKLCHGIAFSTGAGLLAGALRLTTRWSMRKIALVTIAFVSVFGAIDEWHQLYTPKRSGADVGDWTADTIGAALGATIAILPYARRRHSPDAPAAPTRD